MLNKIKKTMILTFISSIFITFTISLFAEDIPYQKPGGIIEDMFNRPYNPSLGILPQINKKILRERSIYMPLDFMAEPVIRIAGIEIYEKSRAKVRSSFTTKFSMANLYSDSLTQINLPENAVYGGEISSFNNKKLVLQQYSKDKITLWMVTTDSLKVTKLLDSGINQVFVESVRWMPDNKNLLLTLVPNNLTKPTPKSTIPSGPIVVESSGKESQNRTYPSLIKNTYDEELFNYYATVQLAFFNTESNTLNNFMEPMILTDISVSPDGNYILCKEILKPFSRKTEYYYFPCQWLILDIQNNKKIILSSRPAYENAKAGWVQTGTRYYMWDALSNNNLFALSTLDDGNPNGQTGFKDETSLLVYPYNNSKSIYKSKDRLSQLNYITPEIIYVKENNWKKKSSKALLINTKTYKQYLIFNKNNDEIYNDPGEIQYKNDYRGYSVPFIVDNNIFFMGEGLSDKGRKPFIDKLNLLTFNKTRIMEANSQDYTDFYYLFDNDPNLLLFTKQNPQSPINYYVYNIKEKSEKALTKYLNNIPEFTQLQKKVIKYQRPDGVQLSGILYLPAVIDSTKKLPLIMSAYPQEYLTAESASQSDNTDKRFNRPYASSMLYMCLEGYAVLNDASFPIIGDPQTVNDTWMAQAIANAKAAIDYLSHEGIIDSNKVIIEGHSYGAFMVVNLLARCDLFAGGIARNGAYNRTLTPFGFQKERRTLWEAKDVYLNLSPFLYVNQIKKPLLLIHSMEDTNPGTYPIQSQRLFEAMEGNAKLCRYVQLPLEDHSYSTKETHLHLLWEYQQFLNKLFNN